MAPEAKGHALSLLAYVFASYAAAPPTPAPSAPASPLVAFSKLSLHADRAPSSTGSTTDSTASSVVSDDGQESVNSPASSAGLSPAALEEKCDKVMEVLLDESIDEDDQPDKLRDLLSSLLAPAEIGVFRLDSLVLALLMRHREDTSPQPGTVLEPLSNFGPMAARPPVSRSGSFRRNFSNAFAISSMQNSANASLSSSLSSVSSRQGFPPVTPTGTLPPASPFRPDSPARSIGFQTSSPGHSPWNSPRSAGLSLNATAAEFKLPAASANGGGTPGGPGFRTRSPLPIGTPGHGTWAYNSSPLGTPKFATSHGSAAGSYFPTVGPGGSGLHHELQDSEQPIPRMPWDAGSSGFSDRVLVDDFDFKDIAPGGSRASSPSLSSSPSASSVEGQGAYLPSSLLAGGDFSEDEGTASTSFSPRDSVPPPSGYYEGRTPVHDHMSPYHQPMMGDGRGYNGLAMPDPHGMDQNEYNAAYSMTPLEVLASVFSTTGVPIEELEKALIVCNWDVDRAIDIIVTKQQRGLLPSEGGHPGVIGTPSRSSSRPGSRPGSALGFHPGAPPSPLGSNALNSSGGLQGQQRFPLSPLGAASGSRPLVVSRDSLESYIGTNGGRSSSPVGPKWRSGNMSGSRQSQRDMDGSGDEGGSHQNGPRNAVGTRICRYYLNGGCLRSDCRFAHDVRHVQERPGRAICRYFLNSVCLRSDCKYAHDEAARNLIQYGYRRPQQQQQPQHLPLQQQL